MHIRVFGTHTSLCISHLEELAVCDNLFLINSINKRFHDGLLLDATHVKAIHIIPNWSSVRAKGTKQPLQTRSNNFSAYRNTCIEEKV